MSKTKDFEVFFIKNLINEKGVLNRVGELLKDRGIGSTLIVTDNGIVKVGIIERLTNSLKKSGIRFVIFSNVTPDPPESLVFEGEKILKENNLEAVIGIGGGSSMDTAKVISLISKS